MLPVTAAVFAAVQLPVSAAIPLADVHVLDPRGPAQPPQLDRTVSGPDDKEFAGRKNHNAPLASSVVWRYSIWLNVRIGVMSASAVIDASR